MDMASIICLSGFFEKLLINAVTATTSMMMYCTMVTELPAQKEPSATSVKVRLHCNIFTAYF